MTTNNPKKPYLTIPEVAEELACTTRNVYKLINGGKLPALRRSERKTLVPAQALRAYQRRLNGSSPSIMASRRQVSRDELQAIFDENAGGRSPQEFYEAFKRGEIDDTSENMTLLVQAVVLGAGAAKAATTGADPFAFAYAARTRH